MDKHAPKEEMIKDLENILAKINALEINAKGEEAKAKDIFIMCKHIHEIVSQILGFSQEELIKCAELSVKVGSKIREIIKQSK